jgi:hypothetical protein
VDIIKHVVNAALYALVKNGFEAWAESPSQLAPLNLRLDVTFLAPPLMLGRGVREAGVKPPTDKCMAICSSNVFSAGVTLCQEWHHYNKSVTTEGTGLSNTPSMASTVSQ